MHTYLFFSFKLFKAGGKPLRSFRGSTTGKDVVFSQVTEQLSDL